MFFKQVNDHIEFLIMVEYCVLLEIEKNLIEKNIQFEMKTVNNNLRLSINNIGRQCITLNADRNGKDYYKVLVEKNDIKIVREIIAQHINS